jgi:hypothetical protein
MPEQIDVDRQRVALLERVFGLARRNVERLRSHDHHQRRTERRLVGEEDPIDGRTSTSCAAGQQVEFDDEIGAGLETPWQAVRREDRARAPASTRRNGPRDSARPRATMPSNPGCPSAPSSTPGHVRGIDANDGVMHGARRWSGTRSRATYRGAASDECAHRSRCGRRRACPPTGGTASPSVSTRSGWPELPVVVPHGRAGRSAGFPFWSAGVGPALDDRELRVG